MYSCCISEDFFLVYYWSCHLNLPMEHIMEQIAVKTEDHTLQNFIFTASVRGGKELVSPYGGGETEACACLHGSSQSTRQAQARSSARRRRLTRTLFRACHSHPVLCGHTVSSVKELIQVKINHFSGQLVLPWCLSCSGSLYSCTNS